MSYLKEFQKEIQKRDFNRFFALWEEYCTNDIAEPREILSLLQMIKGSELSASMGSYVETLIPQIHTIEKSEYYWPILKLLFDIQTTNTEELLSLGLKTCELQFKNCPELPDLLKRVQLREGSHFQGALTQLELLAHFKKGNYVVHWGAFGVGEIMELSFLRENLSIEFEKANGIKTISFASALKTLEPISEHHFLVRRFSFGEEMEALALKSPVSLIRELLRDLGPKTAQEIKEELVGYIIEEEDWSRFWQSARNKIKKDLSFESPDNSKEPFSIRKEATSFQAQFRMTLSKKKRVDEALAYIHSFTREHPDEIEPVQSEIFELFGGWIKACSLTGGELLQVALLKESVFAMNIEEEKIVVLFDKDPLPLLREMEILFYKKIALERVRRKNDQWQKLFLEILFEPQVAMIREYLSKELMATKEGESALTKALEELVYSPMKSPDLFLWCFTKNVIEEKKGLPLREELDIEKWWEGLLLLLSQIEKSPQFADLTKKIMQIICHDRYYYIRILFKRACFEFVREFLLLASKCFLLSEKELANFKALAGVHYPELGGPSEGKEKSSANEVFWTTRGGYLKVEERMRQIADKEMVDSSREIEVARAHGDLRENADYKFAKERRARLQGELKRRSQEFQRARVITEEDVSSTEVAIGSIIEIQGTKGEKRSITILGPWEADPDKDIFSLYSKAGGSLIGNKVGDVFTLQDDTYTITKLSTIFG